MRFFRTSLVATLFVLFVKSSPAWADKLSYTEYLRSHPIQEVLNEHPDQEIWIQTLVSLETQSWSLNCCGLMDWNDYSFYYRTVEDEYLKAFERRDFTRFFLDIALLKATLKSKIWILESLSKQFSDNPELETFIELAKKTRQAMLAAE